MRAEIRCMPPRPHAMKYVFPILFVLILFMASA
jgi:hypothetical protein